MNIQPTMDYMHFDLDKSNKKSDDILGAVMAHHDYTLDEYHNLLKRQRQNPLDVHSMGHVMSYTTDSLDTNHHLISAYHNAMNGHLVHDHNHHNGLQDLIKENTVHRPVTLYSGISGSKMIRMLGSAKDKNSPFLIHVPRHASASHEYNVARKFAIGTMDHPDNHTFNVHKLLQLHKSTDLEQMDKLPTANHILAIHLPAGEHAYASEDHSSFKEEKEWILPHGNIYKIHPNPIKLTQNVKFHFGNTEVHQEDRNYIWHAEFMGRAEPHEVHAHVIKHGKTEPFNYAEQRVVSRWNIL